VSDLLAKLEGQRQGATAGAAVSDDGDKPAKKTPAKKGTAAKKVTAQDGGGEKK